VRARGGGAIASAIVCMLSGARGHWPGPRTASAAAHRHATGDACSASS
jgi:hypothetical protein